MHDFDAHFMQEAISVAIENLEKGIGGPFGAVVVKDGEIIARCGNSVTSTNDPTAHAEVNAIREACKVLGHFQLDDCTIYSSCEPCPMCLGAIYWARPKALYFAAGRDDAALAGFDDSYIYNQIPLPPFNRALPTFQILQQEGLKPFQKWQAIEVKIEY